MALTEITGLVDINPGDKVFQAVTGFKGKARLKPRPDIAGATAYELTVSAVDDAGRAKPKGGLSYADARARVDAGESAQQHFHITPSHTLTMYYVEPTASPLSSLMGVIEEQIARAETMEAKYAEFMAIEADWNIQR